MFFYSFGLLLFSCSSSSRKATRVEKHTVLRKDQKAFFNHPNGNGEIHYVRPFVRKFVFDKQIYKVEFSQRPQEWRHQLGIFNPNEKPLGANGTDIRIVAEESILKFDREEELHAFLRAGAKQFQWIHGDGGLVLGYFYTPGRRQINVSFYKIYVSGSKLSRLPERFENKGYIRIRTTS